MASKVRAQGLAPIIGPLSAPLPHVSRGARRAKFKRMGFLRSHQSPIPNPRIKKGITQVDQQVDQHEKGRDDDDRPLDLQIVPAMDQVDEQFPQPRPGKDHFDDHAPSQQLSHVQPDDRGHGNHGILQDMLEDDAAFRQSLGPGYLHKVLLDDLQHIGTGDPRQDGHGGAGQGDGRQHEVLDRVQACRVSGADEGKPSEADGKTASAKRPAKIGAWRPERGPRPC